MSRHPVFDALSRRRSEPKVTSATPDDAELARLIGAAAHVADHAGLRPWRIVALRGDARVRLGAALVAASGAEGAEAAKLAGKPLRADLLVAVVARSVPSPKVPDWEQEAVAAGVAHALALLLDEAGWGVMWRTGGGVRHPAVAAVHGLEDGERLLGWLYVGGVPERRKHDPKTVDGGEFLTVLG
ncbi:nitroreductase family protein [Agromyces seonyuensis]|uniref:Putative NAD(P)H nitroreductase n=1 Tax=Agromyces seonyuensis TaxID=2662446 RepID=A0A6I4NTE3_9MICO|nr:nitroreductase [Agromyces seonyuensis]